MMVEPNTPTLPQSRVKKIMKMDDDSLLVREETVATMTKATVYSSFARTSVFQTSHPR
jgi:hypothetical protein